MKKSNKIIPVVSLALGLSLGSGICAYAGLEKQNTVYSDPEMTKVAIPEAPDEYKVNANGETYGSSANAVSFEECPDLIAVIGNNGVKGYMHKSDSPLAEQPSSPEEALKLQAEREKLKEQGVKGRTVNVYASDGTTVVDTFTIQY